MSSNIVKKESLTAITLLPPLQKIEKERAKNLSLILTEIALSALEALLEGVWSCFDAPVGDNSCKIRAKKVADLAAKSLDQQEWREKMVLTQRELQKIKTILNALKTDTSSLSLEAFRKEQEIEFNMDEDLSFLIQSHFLFSVKGEKGYEATDPEKLQKIAPLSRNLAKNWIHKIQVDLALASIHYVRQQISLLVDRQKELEVMTSNLFLRSYHKISLLPNLFCMEILFKRALVENHYLIFSIEPDPQESESPRELFLARANANSTAFVLFDPQYREKERPAIAILAKRAKLSRLEERQKLLGSFDLLETLMLAAASDPQYLSGKKSEEIDFSKSHDSLVLEEQKRFEHLKKLAAEQKVASYLQIEHILCCKVSDYF